MEYKNLEDDLRAQSESIARQDSDWTAEEVARKLNEIADLLARIRHQHQTGINASMGKRSGSKQDVY